VDASAGSDFRLPISDSLVFRDLCPADLEPLTALYNESIDGTGEITFITEPVTPSFFAVQLAGLRERERMLVLTSTDEALLGLLPAEHRASGIVGYGALKLWSDRAGYARTGETSVYVWRTLARRGLGTHIKTELIRNARELGYHHLAARVVASNAASLNYNLNCGYELVGIMREAGYIAGKWYDVALLQLLLD
jgi:L-amino acid N-acyltransferase YncA